MKLLNSKFYRWGNSPKATQLLRGLLLILFTTLLLLGTLGCAGDSAENNYPHADEGYGYGEAIFHGELIYNDEIYHYSEVSHIDETYRYDEVNYNDTAYSNDELHYDGQGYHDDEELITFDEDGTIVITDVNFDLQIQEIQMNRNDFIGHTIRYEGLFMSSSWQDETFYFVARLEGGCCGVYGFEVYLNDVPRVDDDTWVEVTGVLEEYYLADFSHNILRLNVISLVER